MTTLILARIINTWILRLKLKPVTSDISLTTSSSSHLQEVMSVEDESTSCYCLLDCGSVHLLLDQPGSYALVGEPLTQNAVKRLKLAVFGGLEAMSYILRVYCVDDTPHAFQVSIIIITSFIIIMNNNTFYL